MKMENDDENGNDNDEGVVKDIVQKGKKLWQLRVKIFVHNFDEVLKG